LRGWPPTSGKAVKREQSSVGPWRLGAGCWERRLPRSARLVSQPPAD
jgi:hypothetical protein